MISIITRIRRYQTIRQKAGDLFLAFYQASGRFCSENPLAKEGIGQGRGLGPLGDTENADREDLLIPLLVAKFDSSYFHL